MRYCGCFNICFTIRSYDFFFFFFFQAEDGIRDLTVTGVQTCALPILWQSYGAAMHCNGNGACYNFDPDDAMCPSWKATRQRVHSPKGRASLMREWLRLQGQAGVNVLEVAQRPQPFLSSLADRKSVV